MTRYGYNFSTSHFKVASCKLMNYICIFCIDHNSTALLASIIYLIFSYRNVGVYCELQESLLMLDSETSSSNYNK